MEATLPLQVETASATLTALGAQIRARRKSLGVTAVAAAQAAGMSRVTLHRIERGEASVAMGAYVDAMAALGLTFGIQRPAEAARERDANGWIPARVRLADYPQLGQLAWQVHGTDDLTPREALDIYERNARHLDLAAIAPHEQQLLDALRLAFSGDLGV